MTRELGLCHHHSSSRGLVLPLLSSPYNHFQAFQSSTVVTGWEASERSGPDQTTGDDDRRRKEPNLRRELTERQLMTRSNSFLGQSLPVPSLVSLPYRYFFNLRIIDINLLPLVTVSSPHCRSARRTVSSHSLYPSYPVRSREAGGLRPCRTGERRE